MKPKTILITGASSGIGQGLAAEIASMGHHLILLSRPSSADREFQQSLKEVSRIFRYEVDLSSIKQVKQIGLEIGLRHPEIDVIFNIAGCFMYHLRKTEEELEYMFATNYLSHFLLTNLLIPNLHKSGNGRVLTISGEGHRSCFPEGINPDTITSYDLLTLENFHSGRASKQIIMAKILFTYELARRLDKSDIQVCTFCPGLTRTKLIRNLPLWLRWYMHTRFFLEGAREPREVAVDICNLAFRFRDIHGKYYIIRRSGIQEYFSSPESYSPSLSDKLWNLSEYLVDEDFRLKKAGC
jgi:NAD(P)-dependent dehydrogenase (short-subunit alcohol dehydrogenase family)